MCHYDLDCHPIFMSFKKKRKKKGLSKIQALPIWKRENPPWNTFKSNITALGAVCCVSEFFCVLFLLYFRGYPAKCKWDVRIFPAWIQHSLTAEHNSAIWKISAANVKFWSQSLRNESSGVFFFWSCHFAPMLKSYKGREVIAPPNYSYYFLHIGNHNLKTRLCEASWGKVNKPKRQKKTTVAWQRQPTIFFVFAYCRLARLNRHIARERSHFNRWLAVLLFARTSPAASHWTRGSSLWAPLVVWNTTAAMETFVSLPKYIFKEIGVKIATLFWNTSYNLLRFSDN